MEYPRQFHKLNHHRLWRYVEISRQNVGHLSRDLALLFDAAALRDVNIDLGHAFPLGSLVEFLGVYSDRDASAIDERVGSDHKRLGRLPSRNSVGSDHDRTRAHDRFGPLAHD